MFDLGTPLQNLKLATSVSIYLPLGHLVRKTLRHSNHQLKEYAKFAGTVTHISRLQQTKMWVQHSPLLWWPLQSNPTST